MNSFLFLAAVSALALSAADWRDQGVLYLDHSPKAVMHPVPIRAVKIGEGFWYERRKVNVERSMPTMYDLLEANGVMDNFRRVSGRKEGPLHGPVYTDSDIYKWIEAAAFSLQSAPNADLQGRIDRAIDEIVAAQDKNGYINTHWSLDRAKDRFTQMERGHELYCLGHMLQAAIAYYRATGNTRLLDAGQKFVNYLVADFGPDKRPLLTGHPELELALAELYRTNGDKHALELAGYLLSGVETQRLNLKVSQTNYMFSGVPFTSRTRLIGHAVRAMYAASGATDYYLETGDAAYFKTLNTLWDDLVRHKLYITGGVGSRSSGEAFGEAWELPNSQAYTESCAAIGNMMWNFRMLTATGEAKYTDMMERALYNGINSGMSLTGTLYCYRNPLAWSGLDPNDKIRNPWYDTTCCPPNLERTLSSLPGYFYATGKDGLWVHFYHDSELDWHLEDGTPLHVTQQTKYPWQGSVQMTVSPAAEKNFALRVRIPGWSTSTKVLVNGAAVTGAKTGEYLAIQRMWKPGDRVTLEFDTRPTLIAANPLVTEDAGKVAVQRGPLIYCLEQPDQQAPVADVLLAKVSAPFAEEQKPDLLGGIVMLTHTGAAYRKPLESEPLYEPVGLSRGHTTKPVELRFIPYYAWSNREPGAMAVWVPAPL
ncbi:MAG: putative glycosyl hydrolase [Bryobacterales bacterium]|nr:putative glycosyl hydrolase [Bryobacterales bacterium]